MLDHNKNREQEIVLMLSKSRSYFSPFLHKDRREITKFLGFFFCPRKITEAGKRQKSEGKKKNRDYAKLKQAFRAFSCMKGKERNSGPAMDRI